MFRGYRKVAIDEPVFVSGAPRSGTTLVHRTLALDRQFTTFSLWECLFAPSVTQRRFYRLLARLDRRVGNPLERILRRGETRLLGALDDVHGTSLADAEEDYFVFMPVLSCFLLVVPFPYACWIWDLGEFDTRVDPAQRSRLMRYYRRCIQKHLYANGTDKRFLSKNASFPPLLGSLSAEFPDARFVFCLRDPIQVVPSQLSSLRDGMEFFCNDPYDPVFRDKMIGLLAYYYRNLIDTPIPEQQREWVRMNQFKTDLAGSIEAIYASFNLPMSDAYRRDLAEFSGAARDYQSVHAYSLDEFGLDAGKLRVQFADSVVKLDLHADADVRART
ncbi:MAG: sulfotransferase [Gammaproteobacteria bacterium]|nr:sulfotransferase [Gammaproteobacteria bacterium]